MSLGVEIFIEMMIVVASREKWEGEIVLSACMFFDDDAGAGLV